MTLEANLRTLENMGLIRLDRVEPEPEFVFRHALLQEAAHNSLLKNEQRELHRQVGEVLESLYADRLESIAVMLAQHFKLGEDYPRALKYFTAAAEAAARQYALSEALDLYNQAIALAQEIGAPYAVLLCSRAEVNEIAGEIDRSLADLEAALAAARQDGDTAEEWQVLINLAMLWASRNYEMTRAYLDLALERARANGDPRQIAHTLNRVGNWHLNIDEPNAAQRYHGESLVLFNELNDRHGLAETLDLLGMANGLSGDMHQATSYFEKAIPIMREINDIRGLSSALTTSSFQNTVLETDLLLSSRQPLTEGLKTVSEGLNLTWQISFPAGEAYSLFVKAQIEESMGDYGQAQAEAELSYQIANEIGHDQWILASSMILGGLHLALFESDRAIPYLERGFELGQSTRSINFFRGVAGFLARAYLFENRLEDADRVLDESLRGVSQAVTIGQRVSWAARGELALARGDPEQTLRIIDLLNRDARLRLPGRVPPRVGLLHAQALAHLERYEKAGQVLRMAQEELDPQGNKSLLWHVFAQQGRLYRALGRLEEAERRLAAAGGLVTEIASTISGEDRQAHFREMALQHIFYP